MKACDEALALDQNSSNSHKWYALLIGARTNFVSMTERIKDGHVFKEHLDKAIKLNPNESTLYHMLGRFLFEVAGLKWYERKTASMLFSEVPTGTYDEALTNFMNSEKLSKEESKENKLYIGKCHIEFGSYRDALKWLDEANNIIDTVSFSRTKLFIFCKLRSIYLFFLRVLGRTSQLGGFNINRKIQ